VNEKGIVNGNKIRVNNRNYWKVISPVFTKSHADIYTKKREPIRLSFLIGSRDLLCNSRDSYLDKHYPYMLVVVKSLWRKASGSGILINRLL